MQIFTALLILAFLGAVVSFALMGLTQSHRSRTLCRRASRLGLRFDADDPFSIASRYGQFALISGGHSCSASNVLHGRLDGRGVKVFDLRFELGHGTCRTARSYRVAILDNDAPLADLLMWHESDMALAPLPARQGVGKALRWFYTGGDELAQCIAAQGQELDARRGSLQVIGNSVLFAVPADNRHDDIASMLPQLVIMVAALAGRLAPQVGSDEHQGVAFPSGA